MFNDAGPLWLGRLWDNNLVGCIYKSVMGKNIMPDRALIKFLKIINEECKINAVGFYDIHRLVKKYKIKKIPKKEALIKKIKNKGYKVSETHFSNNSLRSNIPINRLIRML